MVFFVDKAAEAARLPIWRQICPRPVDCMKGGVIEESNDDSI